MKTSTIRIRKTKTYNLNPFTNISLENKVQDKCLNANKNKQIKIYWEYQVTKHTLI